MPELAKRRRRKLQAVIDRDYEYQSYRDKDVEVRSGGPCGRGLYAVRQFLPGELVVEVGGQLHRKKDYPTSLYVMELDDKWYLEPDIPAAKHRKKNYTWNLRSAYPDHPTNTRHP